MLSIKEEYDHNQVRFRLAKVNPSNKEQCWLFLPGGAGADSSYYLTLIEQLAMPGQYWLMDFPANGDNFPDGVSEDYHFDNWLEYFLPAIKRFKNPILVGQSFGGMLPLLFPELEKYLNGLIIFNSAPKLWLAEAAHYAKTHHIESNEEAKTDFRTNPSKETFRSALLANTPYHFPPHHQQLGKAFFKSLPFNYLAMQWWSKKAQTLPFNAQWIPQQIPTLIVNGKLDFVVPYTVYNEDPRFNRRNIQIKVIENAGHFAWLDEIEEVLKALNSFKPLEL